MSAIFRFLGIAAIGFCVVFLVGCSGGTAVSKVSSIDGTPSTSSTIALTSTSTIDVPEVSIPVESSTTFVHQNPTTTVASGPSAAEIAAQKEAQYQAIRLKSFNDCLASAQSNYDQYVRNTTSTRAHDEASGLVTAPMRELWRQTDAIQLRELQNAQQGCRTLWGF